MEDVLVRSEVEDVETRPERNLGMGPGEGRAFLTGQLHMP